MSYYFISPEEKNPRAVADYYNMSFAWSRRKRDAERKRRQLETLTGVKWVITHVGNYKPYDSTIL
jgi:hypothetical protein